MARRRHEPEKIVAKLRQVEALAAQGKSIAVTETTYFRFFRALRAGWACT